MKTLAIFILISAFGTFVYAQSGYTTLSKTAKSVRFAKGESSATFPVLLKNADEQKVFRINARKGQELEISAESCAITVYQPNRKIYQIPEWENGDERTFTETTIDFLTIETLPQTGIYLIVLKKMTDNALPKQATFKIKD